VWVYYRGFELERRERLPLASVLVLLWGRPPRVLVERKACNGQGYWRCDIALPGGHVKEGESPEQTALREAWEEAWVYPRAVEVLGALPETRTKFKETRIIPVLAKPRGPLCPMPRSEEVDQVFWLRLDEVKEDNRRKILHPARRILVRGIVLPGGGVLWGATLRILDALCMIMSC
jgi:8-oxo-dGTP pyrophosphatase MutT (NUDIX family)